MNEPIRMGRLFWFSASDAERATIDQESNAETSAIIMCHDEAMAELAEMPTVLRLDLAVVGLPEAHPAAHRGGNLPVYGYCILHPDGPILFDTGVGFGNDFIDELYHPQREILGEVLSRSGVQLDTVVAVVNSHLHFDHCGQNPSLFNSPTTFLAQATEYRTVAVDEFYTDSSWALPPEHQRRVVNGDEQLAEGLTILATPGHTAGHQSLLIEADGRCVVIGGQLVLQVDELVGEVASVENVDPDPSLQEAAVDSMRRIKALNPEVIHLSHCAPFEPNQWDVQTPLNSGALATELRPQGLATRAHAEYDDSLDLLDMVREDPVAERVAIESYSEIIAWLGSNDPTTRRMLEDILAMEEEHADDLLSILEAMGT